MSKVFKETTPQQCYDRMLGIIRGDVDYDEEICLNLISTMKSSNIDGKNEASINMVDGNGLALLHHACRHDHTDIATLLIENKASINAKTSFDATPLHYACRHDHTDIATLLIENKASINAKTSFGVTPLHYACSGDYTDIATLLIESQANINITDNGGQTPLHYACGLGYINIAELLIESGADITLSSIGKKKPLDHIKDPKLKKELQQLAQEYQANKTANPSAFFQPQDEQPSNNNEELHSNNLT